MKHGLGSKARRRESGPGAEQGPALRAIRVIPDNLSLLTLPPYSPDLNPVENVWQYIRANWLAISVFDTREAIVDACCIAWNRFAADPKIVTSITNRSWATVR